MKHLFNYLLFQSFMEQRAARRNQRSGYRKPSHFWRNAFIVMAIIVLLVFRFA